MVSHIIAVVRVPLANAQDPTVVIVEKDQYGTKITEWWPDMFKTKDGSWTNYDPSCIHLACPDKSNVDWNGYTWYCN